MPPPLPPQALADAASLDAYLAQADALRPLFVALNDESVAVRATAVRLVGRLAAWNPAYVAPALRRHLLQLLTDMEHSPDSRWGGGEEGAGKGAG
jgi:FKBP12-rapamycin complex-associated protein